MFVLAKKKQLFLVVVDFFRRQNPRQLERETFINGG